MHYFEGAARVPMIAHYPKWFTPKHVSQSVSTLDVLPTFVELVGGKVNPDLSLEGRSLVAHLHGDTAAHDEVIGEYFGEGTSMLLFHPSSKPAF